MAYQIYLLHLLDGTVVKAYEEYGTPTEDGFIGDFICAGPDRVFEVGNPDEGFIYVPKRNILYVSTGEVKKDDIHHN